MDALGGDCRAHSEKHEQYLEAVTENHHRSLNMQAAEIVAEAKAASESALTEVRTLGRRMGIDTRS